MHHKMEIKSQEKKKKSIINCDGVKLKFMPESLIAVQWSQKPGV